MNGEYLENLDDLKRCFSFDELIYNYGSGELEIWLRKIGEIEKAEKIRSISKIDANILVRLYEIFGLDLNMSEEEIRESVTLK